MGKTETSDECQSIQECNGSSVVENGTVCFVFIQQKDTRFYFSGFEKEQIKESLQVAAVSPLDAVPLRHFEPCNIRIRG